MRAPHYKIHHGGLAQQTPQRAVEEDTPPIAGKAPWFKISLDLSAVERNGISGCRILYNPSLYALTRSHSCGFLRPPSPAQAGEGTAMRNAPVGREPTAFWHW
jgi:hypothetical protein